MARQSKVWFWVSMVIGSAAVLAGAFLLDPAARHFMLNHRSRDLGTIMAAVSRYGDWPEHVVLGLILLAIAWWKKNTRWARVFLAMLIACALAGAAARVVKIATGRARPSVKTEMTWNGPRLSEKYHAFPSGHTACSAAFFAVLFFVNWRIGLFCLSIPILIAFSRMYVAAHYLSDVIFALHVGIGCSVITAHFLKIRGSPARSANDG